MSTLQLATRLREETQSLHRVAERSGVMRDLLHGRLDQRDYCLMLRNLHAIYETLESALDRHAATACNEVLRNAARARLVPLQVPRTPACAAQMQSCLRR